jgi:hypothetical protein
MRKKQPKKARQVKRISKTEYRERELHDHLKRYADYDSLLASGSFKDFPHGPFQVRVGEHICAAVMVNWQPIRQVLTEMFELPESDTPYEQRRRMSEAAATTALLHVAEFLPEKFDAAMTQMCEEAKLGLFKTRATIKRVQLPGLAKFAEDIVEREKEAIKDRLQISAGPSARFLHRGHYEADLEDAAQSLVDEGKPVTLGNIAEKLSSEKEFIDERVIRRWNDKYGVDWKSFARQHRERT